MMATLRILEVTALPAAEVQSVASVFSPRLGPFGGTFKKYRTFIICWCDILTQYV